MNDELGKLIEDPRERLEMVSQQLGVNLTGDNGLWKALGYSTPGTVNAIIYGKTKNITQKFARNFVEKFPNVNYLFLLEGKLPIMVSDSVSQAQINLLSGKDVTLETIFMKLEVISRAQIKILKEIEYLKQKKER